MSSSLVRTLREDPADAEVPSHRLLVRAGYVRRVAAGIYTWLPLGLRVLANVTRVVREEMERIGCQEVLFPALLPVEPYDLTGRTGAYGDLLRGREFAMKDAYSFDLDDSGLQKSYDAQREAYQRIFARLGVRHRIVTAVSGAMGGSASEEFLAPTPAGEDTFVLCGQCEYAANAEAVPAVVAPVPAAEHPPMEVLDTPDTPTIQTLAERLGVPASATLKNLLVWVDDQIVAVGVPGDREVDMGRLEEALAPARVRIVEPADFAGRPDLVRGYVGPQGRDGRAFRYLADPRVAPGTSWVTGANQVDRHARNVVCGRDFTVDEYLDAVVVVAGDPCPRCGAPLAIDRGVEVGHIFQLGR